MSNIGRQLYEILLNFNSLGIWGVGVVPSDPDSNSVHNAATDASVALTATPGGAAPRLGRIRANSVIIQRVHETLVAGEPRSASVGTSFSVCTFPAIRALMSG